MRSDIPKYTFSEVFKIIVAAYRAYLPFFIVLILTIIGLALLIKLLL